MMPAEHPKRSALLEAGMQEDKRSVIQFLVSKGNKPIEIHHRMRLRYGEVYLSLQQVYEWSGKFKNLVPSIMDATQLGQHQVLKP